MRGAPMLPSLLPGAIGGRRRRGREGNAMQRRLATLLIACTVLSVVPASGSGRAVELPNIVLILTDDQRWDTLWTMPIVQRELAGRGVTFSNAFVVNSLCCP